MEVRAKKQYLAKRFQLMVQHKKKHERHLIFSQKEDNKKTT